MHEGTAGGIALDSHVTSLPGVGDKRAELLAQLNIATVRDLLFHFPRSYQDRRNPTPLGEINDGDTVTVCAEVVKSRILRLRRGLSMAEVSLRDASGTLKAIWFGQPYLAQAFKAGARGFFSGQAGKWNGLALRNPEYELLTGDEDDLLNSGRIVPVYRLTEGVSQRMLRRLVRTALDGLREAIADALPPDLAGKYSYPPADAGLRTIHFPEELDAAKAARNRFAYEELLGIQLGVLLARQARRHESKAYRHVTDGERLGALRTSLPFALTGAQQRAVADILEDMASERPMVRLLQGDVGCGKTAVALHAIAAAADGGFQTALMAPTEILAEQHALTLRDALGPLGIEVASLTGSTAGARGVVEALASGECHVIVGTHALIQDRVSFHRLGLVIIDEQHRFGVVQRAALLEKGLNPDMLHMTATPIPRTLAVTVYGGMDVTVIDELPPNRAPVKTSRVPPAKVPGLYDYIREQAAQGRQTYIICPLVEESLARALTAVTTHFEQLGEGPLKGMRLGLLHGRLSSSEKDEVMHRFKRGDLDVLVSTTVIEVGIDCPNATTIVIEDAAQFGLPQLHQLRGRVGRGNVASRCFLLGKPKTPDGRQRLEILCGTNSGFEIAESDLEMRGPGEFRGVRQAGLSDLRVADLIRDVRILDAARRDAQAILEVDPGLALQEHAALAVAARSFAALTA
ncbi:MAG: ATP-dependent DNA helicase RecG [Candidatus Hydrogenedentes bacterium]|nr:ATP-dependent DNA helicase RecG [Candidatus Hydrogenedentota bacterium]